MVGNLRVGASLHVGMLLNGDSQPVTFSLIKVLRLPLFWMVYLCRAVLPLRGRFLQSFVDGSSSGNVPSLTCVIKMLL